MSNAHYRLRCLETGELFDDTDRGFLLANEAARAPALMRAEYDSRRFQIDTGEPGIFRYRSWLPVRRSLPEAGGPIAYRSDALARRLGAENLWIIFNGYWPERGADLQTCTFKELESLSVLARVPEAETRSMVVSSAGNTARSFLQTASLHGFRVTAVVPEFAMSSMWLTVDRSPSVELVMLAGDADYLDAIQLGGIISDLEGYYPEGGAKNVARRDGMGTTMLAAAEAIGEAPQHYVQAVGSGTGGIGAWEMSMRLAAAAGEDSARTRLHLVQNEPFTIMTDAWQSGSRDLPGFDEAEARRDIASLYAPVLSNRKPPYAVRGGVFDALSSSGGSMYAVTNEEAVAAGEIFDRLEGCDIAPAAQVALAGLIEAIDTEQIGRSDTIALNITGGGVERVEREGITRQLEPDVVIEPHEVTPEKVARKLASSLVV